MEPELPGRVADFDVAFSYYFRNIFHSAEMATNEVPQGTENSNCCHVNVRIQPPGEGYGDMSINETNRTAIKT